MFFCSIQKNKAQCTIFFVPTATYNCLTNQAYILIPSLNGGTPPYSYTLVNTSTNATVAVGLTSINSATTPNLPSGTNVNIYVSSSGNCSGFSNLTVSNSYSASNASFTTIHNVSCHGGNDGNVFVVAPTSFSSGLTYTWSPGGLTSQNNSSLSAGVVYSVTVSDAQGCSVTNTVSVTEPAIINSQSSNTVLPCFGTYSTILTSTGGVAPFSYTLNGTATPTLAHVTSGTQTLLTKDANACIVTHTFAGSPSKITTSALTHSENCSAADGAFTLSVSGGTPAYSYTSMPGSSTSSVVTNLSAGTFTTFVKDANNCADTIKFIVGNLSAVTLSIAASNSVSCYNNCNGSVTLAIQNAAQPVTYSASSTPTTNSNILSNLCAGFYNIYAIDAVGCPATVTLNFPAPAAFSYSAPNPPLICYGKQTSLTASASGGSGGYNYVWSPGNITGQTVTVHPPATTVYSLNVYDSKGCTLAPYTITLSVNPQISIAINSSNAGICPGSTAQITPTVSGGDGNYVYTWFPGNFHGASIFVENLSVPVYSLTVNDGCGSPTAYQVIPIKIFPIIQPLYAAKETNGCAPFCTQFFNRTPKSKKAVWNFGDKPFEQIGDTTKYCYDKAGIYTLRLTVTDSNSCKTSFDYTNAIIVKQSPHAEFITEPAVITLANAQDVQVRNISNNATDYQWFLNKKSLSFSQDINYTFNDTGCYRFKLVAINANACKDSVEKNICVVEGFHFFMPTAFTPDRDNLNDVLTPQGTGWLAQNYVFEVYNRWGSRIFRTTDISVGWDGGITDSNADARVTYAKPNDTYVWRVLVTDNLQKIHSLKGRITLLR